MRIHLLSSNPSFRCTILPPSLPSSNKVSSFIVSNKRPLCKTRKRLILHAMTSVSFRSPFKLPAVTPLFSNLNSSTQDDEDNYCNGAMEAVLKLYSGIKKRDFQVVSDIIGDECRCMLNNVLSLKQLQGKKEVLEFFSSLIRIIGTHMEIVIQPISNDGINVVVQWTLECSKTHALLGNGITLHVCHRFQGKVVIRNIEIFMEPIFHIEPSTLKLIGALLAVMDRFLAADTLFTECKEKGVPKLLGLLVMVISLFVFFFIGL